MTAASPIGNCIADLSGIEKCCDLCNIAFKFERFSQILEAMLAAENGLVDKQWFKKRMSQQGLSQNDMAVSMGIHRSAFSKILAGQRQVKAVEVRLIAELLGQSTAQILARLAGEDQGMTEPKWGSNSAEETTEGEMAGFFEESGIEFQTGKVKPKHPGFGFMKGMMTFADDFDPTEPAFPDWEQYENEKYGRRGKTPK